MDRLTRTVVAVNPKTAQYLGDANDIRDLGDMMLELVLNAPTLTGVRKDALRQMIRQLYEALAAYEDTGLTPERAAELAQAEAEANEPLTQDQISSMHFDKIWLDYGEDNGGEWAVVLFGKIYSIDTLEGAGFEEMLFDLADGETLDHPSGRYTVRRHKPKEVADR